MTASADHPLKDHVGKRVNITRTPANASATGLLPDVAVLKISSFPDDIVRHAALLDEPRTHGRGEGWIDATHITSVEVVGS